MEDLGFRSSKRTTCMPWKISYLEDTKIIKTIYTEPITLDELKECAMANFSMAAEKQTGLFLGDCSSFTQQGSTMDIYKLGKFLESISLELRIHIKEALIEPSNIQRVSSDLRFFETVTNNRMIKARIFQDTESALEWLLN